MAIPVAYNLRNLVVRKTTTIMTALGIALTVAVLLAVLALVNGLRTTLASSGDPLQIVVHAQGLGIGDRQQLHADAVSGLEVQAGHRQRHQRPAAGIAGSDHGGQSVQHRNRRRHQHDGARPAARRYRDAARREDLASGRWFQEGRRELVAGKSAAERYPEVQIGRKIRFRPRRLGDRRHHGCRARRAGQRDLGRPESGGGRPAASSKC